MREAPPVGASSPDQRAMRWSWMALRAEVGDRSVCKQQLARRETARVVAGQPGAAAEEGDLEAVGRRRRGVPSQPVAYHHSMRRAQVGAVVAGKGQRPATAHGVDPLGSGHRAGQQRRPHQKVAAPHQSSFTDSTAADRAAARAR